MNDSPDGSVDAWLDRFLDVHLRRHPVDATFIGVHEHDHDLPPIGEAGVDETVAAMRALLEESASLRASAVDGVGRADRESSAVDGVASFAALDRHLARGFLRARIREYESGHLLANPSAHAGDAVFGLMGPLLSDYAPLSERLEAVRSRLAALPAFLEAAEVHGRRGRTLVGSDGRGGRAVGRRGRAGDVAAGRAGDVPASWARRAIRECGAGHRFLTEGLRHLEKEAAGSDGAPAALDALLREAPAGARAFRRFADFLEREVLPSGSDDVACGPEAFESYLREAHFLDRPSEEIAAYAREEMARTRSWLEARASDFGAEAPSEVLATLADSHPGPEAYLDRYRETWESMRAAALDLDLVTWPDFPIEYVPRPAWARGSAPDLYFLFYRSPAAVGRPDVHRYLVAPLDPALSPAEIDAFLRANNDSVIKLNHVVHHGGIGHHVQNWHAFRSPSRIGRIAAVDCASRIAMLCGGTMAEGWACYATDLMAEAGALTEREQYAEHHGRVRMCARAIVDIELHHGRMTLGDAVAFYRERADMSPSAAEAEAVKNSMFPGSALMYLVGTDLIHDLRADLMRTLGEDFGLRAFHDAFLSYGSMPVKLIADEMRRRAAGGLPLGAHCER